MTPRTGRRGFAMITAIVLMGITALTLAGLAAAFANEARRTRMQADQAQLRQLLLAGTQAAESRLSDANEAQEFSVPLPDELKRQGGSLELKMDSSAASGDRIVHVEATFNRHRLTQQLHFERKGKLWKLVAADLGG